MRNSHMLPTRPLWVDPLETTYPMLSESISVDAAVIGGGIAGVGAARWLAAAGVKHIAVLEARTVVAAASGRNAGFVMAVAPENFPLTDDAGELAAARRIWSFTAENQRQLEAAIDEFEIDASYRKLGSLGLAASLGEWERMRATTRVAQASGLGARLFDRQGLDSPWLRAHYFGGVFYPANAEMQPAKFVRGLASALARQGVRFFEHSPVSALSAGSSTSPVRLQAGRYEVRAAKVVVATNAYLSALLPKIGAHVSPTRGQVLATTPLNMTVASCPVYANAGFQYWRQTPEGRLVVGGWRDLDVETEVGTEEILNQAIQTALERAAAGLCGGPVQIDHRWSGVMGFTPDRRPLAGLVPEYHNVAMAAGFSGHGLAMAFNASKVAVEALLGTPVRCADLFDPGRFPGSANGPVTNLSDAVGAGHGT